MRRDRFKIVKTLREDAVSDYSPNVLVYLDPFGHYFTIVNKASCFVRASPDLNTLPRPAPTDLQVATVGLPTICWILLLPGFVTSSDGKSDGRVPLWQSPAACGTRPHGSEPFFSPRPLFFSYFLSFFLFFFSFFFASTSSPAAHMG